MIVSRKAWFIHVTSNPIIGGNQKEQSAAASAEMARYAISYMLPIDPTWWADLPGNLGIMRSGLTCKYCI